MPTQEKQIQIRIPDDVLKGHYANIVQAHTTREEFILDFGVFHPVQGTGIVTDRIFMNPAHVKRMIGVLSNLMIAYEKHHGSVAEATEPKEIGFNAS